MADRGDIHKLVRNAERAVLHQRDRRAAQHGRKQQHGDHYFFRMQRCAFGFGQRRILRPDQRQRRRLDHLWIDIFGQTLQVRLTSSASGSTVLTATVTVASSSTNWTVTTAALDACTGTATPPTVGQACTDGSVYAGVTPDGNVEMFAAPCHDNITGRAGSCTGTRAVQRWSGGGTVTTGITNQSTGKANTLALHNDDGNADTPYSAADYCFNLSGYLGHSDWYLPALGELNVTVRPRELRRTPKCGDGTTTTHVVGCTRPPVSPRRNRL